ncbi:hypothetical protein Tco_1577577 [Tanacetum coccineum]
MYGYKHWSKVNGLGVKHGPKVYNILWDNNNHGDQATTDPVILDSPVSGTKNYALAMQRKKKQNEKAFNILLSCNNLIDPSFSVFHDAEDHKTLFAKYQENRANGRKEKKIVAIEDSNSKALVATDNNEEIDWTKEFDAEPNLALLDKMDLVILTGATKLMIHSVSALMANKLREEDLKDYSIIGQLVCYWKYEQMTSSQAVQILKNSKCKKYCYGLSLDGLEVNSVGVFFLAYKDDTYDILPRSDSGLENKLRHKEKTIRSDHGIRVPESFMNDFCAKKNQDENIIIARLHSKMELRGKGSTYDEVEALDDQQFIVHVPSINAASE